MNTGPGLVSRNYADGKPLPQYHGEPDPGHYSLNSYPTPCLCVEIFNLAFVLSYLGVEKYDFFVHRNGVSEQGIASGSKAIIRGLRKLSFLLLCLNSESSRMQYEKQELDRAHACPRALLSGGRSCLKTIYHHLN